MHSYFENDPVFILYFCIISTLQKHIEIATLV